MSGIRRAPPVRRCIVCREIGPPYECTLYVRDAAGEQFLAVRCGAWYHGGDCLRSHLAECGLSEESRRKVSGFRRRAAGARANWHGSAGNDPGL